MKKSWIVALREFKERLKSRSFVVMALLGPLTVLGLVYALFAMGGKHKAHWNVLIVDPESLMDNKIMAKEDASLTYSFANNYIEIEDFANNPNYKSFDALVEINEKVLSNKKVFLFYREKPAEKMLLRVQYQVERRIEELLITQFTTLSLSKFRELKQPLLFDSRNVYDPLDEAAHLRGWVGFFFGGVIVLFIFLFGMTILRSISREKSNRIVEVLLATLKPRQLMLGKIMGIGLSAFLQFAIWVLVIGVGLYFMRETLFPDLLDASNMNITQLTAEMKNLSNQELALGGNEYNRYVELVYDRIDFGIMLSFFVLFFALGYFFYASLFAGLGAITGSESDGQQFVIPLILILCLGLYAGYFAIEHPQHQLTYWFSLLPFTSPVVCLVKIAQGYAAGTAYQLILSLLFLFTGAIALLWLSGRLYKNGILQFGHRLRWSHIFKWIRRA